MKTRAYFGAALILIGIGAADSPSLLFPLAAVLVGAWMLKGVTG